METHNSAPLSSRIKYIVAWNVVPGAGEFPSSPESSGVIFLFYLRRSSGDEGKKERKNGSVRGVDVIELETALTARRKPTVSGLDGPATPATFHRDNPVI